MWNGDMGRLYLIGVYGCAGAAELGAAADKARSEEEGSTRGTTLRHPPSQRNTKINTHTVGPLWRHPPSQRNTKNAAVH